MINRTQHIVHISPSIKPIIANVVSSSLPIPIAPKIIAKGPKIIPQQHAINPKTNANVPKVFPILSTYLQTFFLYLSF